MARADFIPQTIVQHITGRKGVVVPDLPGPLNCNGPEEVGVVYEGAVSFTGTDYKNLTIIGPENAVADLEKCGAGRGPECCKFLVVGMGGPECQRFGTLRWTLVFKTMKAEREPTEPYPLCQLKT